MKKIKVTIEGEAGSGKDRLALAVSDYVNETFEDYDLKIESETDDGVVIEITIRK